jgi:RNA polymerase sigma-70 factor (ECF subfamily)
MGLLRAAALFQPPWPFPVLLTRPVRLVTSEDALDQAMDRYAQGEDASFAVLYAGLEGKLRAFLTRLTGVPSVADDLLQETFMRIHRARGGFESGGSVVPWAYAIARNAWLDHVRSSKVRSRVQLESSEEQPLSTDPPTGPEYDSEQAVIAREMAALVEKVLAGLPPAQREAFVLLRYEGMSVQQAAEVLGSTPTAVKLRAFRAYEALRHALGRTREGGDE